jgi:hypothetical protein
MPGMNRESVPDTFADANSIAFAHPGRVRPGLSALDIRKGWIEIDVSQRTKAFFGMRQLIDFASREPNRSRQPQPLRKTLTEDQALLRCLQLSPFGHQLYEMRGNGPALQPGQYLATQLVRDISVAIVGFTG